MVSGSFGTILILLAGITAFERLFPSVRFDYPARKLYTLMFEPKCSSSRAAFDKRIAFIHEAADRRSHFGILSVQDLVDGFVS